jgi:arylsulfatase A-like enzyme
MPVLIGETQIPWREYAVSEADYAWRNARKRLNLEPDQSRAAMICDTRWKYIHYEHFRPQLFDLLNDPQELHDLGEEPAQQTIRERMNNALYEWYRQRKNRSTIRNDSVDQQTGKAHAKGYLFGVW